MITRENYEEKIKIIGLENIDPILKTTHSWYEEVKDLYDEDEEIKDTIDLYFKKLEKYLQKEENQKENVSKPEEKVIKVEAVKNRITAKPRAEKIRKPIRDNLKDKKHQKKESDVTLVELLTDDIKIIRRYVGLHDKKKDSSAILNLIKALQKAVVEKRIIKTSKYASEIKTIQEKLVKVFNGMGKEVHLFINDKDF